MEKFVPYEKMSKKQKRKIDAKKRGDWRNVNPVTRVERSALEYRRHPKHRADIWEESY